MADFAGDTQKTRKKLLVSSVFLCPLLSVRLLLLVAVAVTAHELVHAAGGVDELLLAGEEGVRRAGDFKLYQGIGNAVYLDFLTGGYCGTGDEDLIV